MPLYEYEREDGSRFELLQKFSDEPISECPTTGQKVKRLISESAFHLKGTGWYKTDYKNKPPKSKNKGKQEGSTDSAETTKKDKGSESKSETGTKSESSSSDTSSSGSGKGSSSASVD